MKSDAVCYMVRAIDYYERPMHTVMVTDNEDFADEYANNLINLIYSIEIEDIDFELITNNDYGDPYFYDDVATYEVIVVDFIKAPSR